MKNNSLLAAATFVAATVTASAARGENVLCISDLDPQTADTDSAFYRTGKYYFADQISNAVTVAIWAKDMSGHYEKFIAGVMYRWNLAILHTADNATNKKIVFRTQFGNAIGSGYVLNDGKWHFIVGTYNYDATGTTQSSQRLYVDGEKVAEKTDNLGVFSATAYGFSLGASAKGNASGGTWGDSRNDIKGRFAELSVWNRALSESEVKALYEGTSRLGGNENGLVAYWPLTGETGTGGNYYSFTNIVANASVPNLASADAKKGSFEADDGFTLPYVRCVASPEWCTAKGYTQAESATGRSWNDPLTNLAAVVAAAKPFERILCSPGNHLIESQMRPRVDYFRLGSQDSETKEPCSETAVIDAQGRCRHFISSADVATDKSGFILENLTFANGNPGGSGGSMYFNSNTGIIRSCTFRDNAATGSGGAIYSFTANGTVISNCVFAGNSATTYGGAIHTQQNSNSRDDRCFVIDCVITNNSAQYGGAINAERCINVSGSTFIGNRANTGSNTFGGNARVGIYSTISNCTFTGACQARYGSCLQITGSNATVVDCDFTGLAPSGFGGALYGVMHINNASGVTFADCFVTNTALPTVSLFWSERSSESYVASFLARQSLFDDTVPILVANYKGGKSRFENCTILSSTFDNKASTSGQNVLVNCIVPNANITTSGNFVNIITNSLVNSVTGGTQDSNVMTGTPKFVDAANGDYRLAYNSPCREKGLVLGWMAGATDLDGNPRLVNLFGRAAADALPDLGCYECQERGELPTVVSFR